MQGKMVCLRPREKKSESLFQLTHILHCHCCSSSSVQILGFL